MPPAASYGLVTEATDDAAATFRSSDSICAFTAGSFTDPSVVRQTMVPDSPACWGRAALRSPRARDDSVPERPIEFEKELPTAFSTPTTEKSTTNQAATTITRCL